MNTKEHGKGVFAHGKAPGIVAAMLLAAASPGWAQVVVVPLGQEFQVNTYTTNGQTYPEVGPDGHGGVVVVWGRGGGSGAARSSYSVPGQWYSADGAALGAQFQVNTYTTSGQFSPAVGPDGAGGFVVVWDSYGSAGTDS